jgi:hypothetical protein
MKSNLSAPAPHASLNVARPRRADVFNRIAEPTPAPSHSRYLAYRKAQAPGVDGQGRFIGRGDVERGFAFFLKSRGQSVTHFNGGFGGEFGRGTQSKRQARTHLSDADLLAIHERARRGDKPYLIAKSYGVDRTTIVYALRPSPAMARALATQSAMAA